MTDDNQSENRRSAQYIEALVLVASWAVVGSASYMQGRLDGSRMAAAEFSEYTAYNDPLWAVAVFAIGMVVIGMSIIVFWRYHK